MHIVHIYANRWSLSFLIREEDDEIADTEAKQIKRQEKEEEEWVTPSHLPKWKMEILLLTPLRLNSENTYRSFSKVKNDFTDEQRDSGWAG